MLLFSFWPLGAQQPVTIFQNGMESTRLNLGWGINVTDEYSDFSGDPDASHIDFECMDSLDQVLWGDNSPTRFPFDSDMHYVAPGNVHTWLGARNFFRHGARADNFLRAPYCAQGENFHNGQLLTSSGQCNDITPTGGSTSYLEGMTDALDNSFYVWGLYQKNSSDFFYEVQHQTAGLPYNGGAGSMSLCRTDGLGAYYNTQPSFTLNNIGVGNPFGLRIIPTQGGSASCPTAHYLCVNGLEWRPQLISRMNALGATHPDFVIFDEWANAPTL
jgi:hypothetical protein